MGWPRKDEIRLYFERKNKTYLLINTELSYNGSHEGIGETLTDNNPNNPMLSSTSVSPSYLYKSCRRTSWNEMPSVWQAALKQWLQKDPTAYRGLWRIGEREEYLKIQNTPTDFLPLFINEKWKFKSSQTAYEKRLKYACSFRDKEWLKHAPIH